MSDYPFLPKTPAEGVQRIAERVQNLVEGLLEPERNHRFPKWVRKMAAGMGDQAFSTKTSRALASGDVAFLTGFLGGMFFALQHVLQHSPPEDFNLALLVGIESGKRFDLLRTQILPDCVQAGQFLQVPELREGMHGVLDSIPNLTNAERIRLFEGLLAGGEIEEMMRNGPLRPGLAHNPQIAMLVYWPELEAMPTRRKAYEFIQFVHRNSPSDQRSEEVFFRLAKDYGFKSRKMSR